MHIQKVINNNIKDKGKRLSHAKRQTAKLKKELDEWFTMHYTLM